MNVYTQWKKYIETNNPSATDMALYAIARSIGSSDPLTKALYLLHTGFTPISNIRKIRGGNRPYMALAQAVGTDYATSNFFKTYKFKLLAKKFEEIFDIKVDEDIRQLMFDVATAIKICINTPYSYIIVRKDLDPAVQTVQSVHAMQEITMENPKPYQGTHVVVLGVDNEEELIEASKHLKKFNRVIKHHMFHETDVGYTAIATSPITSQAMRRVFSKFSLLS